MGNCQAAEAAMVVIERPGGREERIYWSVSANEVMKKNPGHYVAVIIGSIPSNPQANTPTIKQLKLLRPEDTLHIGHVYRLVCFEEVARELSGRKYAKAKLNKVLAIQREDKQSERREATPRESVSGPQRTNDRTTSTVAVGTGSCRESRRGRPGQWRPALQSIDEGTR